MNTVPYERGAVGMALSGKNTSGSQWFVTHSPRPHLDGRLHGFRLNNGELWSRQVYNYEGNRKETLFYGKGGDLWSESVEILDENGNVTESYSKDENDKIVDRNFSTYEFDEKGNWIVQKTFEKKKVKGKTVSEILWISYRTITYYP